MVPKACIHFAKGNCRNGESCTFSHDVGQQGQGMPGPKMPFDPSNQKPAFYPRDDHNSFQKDRRPFNPPGEGNFNPRGNNGFQRRNDNSESSFNQRREFYPRDDRPPQNPRFDNPRYPQNREDVDPISNPNSFQNQPYHNPRHNPPGQKPPYDSMQNQSKKDLIIQIENLKQIYENEFLFTNNNICKSVGWPEIQVKSATLVDNFIIFLVEGRNFIVVFDISKKTFIEKQQYLTAEINESINSVCTGKFGNIIGSDFSTFSYYKINELTLSLKFDQKMRDLRRRECILYIS